MRTEKDERSVSGGERILAVLMFGAVVAAWGWFVFGWDGFPPAIPTVGRTAPSLAAPETQVNGPEALHNCF